MAGRNLKPGGFDSMDKMHSNTLKRHPKMDLSRNDLLQLLSCLEGELQARDVTIAALKADKAKQLLYQAKYGRFGLGDPFSAMQRDSDNMKDNAFDESAIKSMYDNQLNQLENLIATQRKAQMKMRDHIMAAEKRYQKVCNELDEEKQKHAQDTAQGDDVTYMLEKERERLKQEVDFEKSNTKKMEKDLKKTLASLEEERANSAKHKQVALMLIKERKKLVEKLVVEKQKATEAIKQLNEERVRSMNMAEGLVQESKKSLQMEATMEKQLSEFDLEREQLKNKLFREENRTRELQAQVDLLKGQIESLQKQNVAKSPRDNFQTIEIKSSVTPQSKLTVDRGQVRQLSSGSPVSVQSNVLSAKSKFVKSPMDMSGLVEHEAGLSPRDSPSEHLLRKRDNTRYGSPQPAGDRGGIVHYIGGDPKLETRVAPVGASADKSLNEPYTSQKPISLTPGSTIVAAGGRITVQTSSANVASGPTSPRKVISVGRGAPPPIPPNKPVLSTSPTPIQVSKPIPPSKVGVSVSKDNRVTVSGDSVKYATPHSGGKSVQIPVSVVHTTTTASGSGSRTPKRDGSPATMRKPTQLSNPASPENPTPLSVPDSFDFLGQEMADLQQLLVSMVTAEDTAGGLDPKSKSSSSAMPSVSSAISPSTLSTSFLESSSRLSSCSPKDFQPSRNVSSITVSSKSSGLSKSLDFDSSRTFSAANNFSSSPDKVTSPSLSSFQSSRLFSPTVTSSNSHVNSTSIFVRSSDKPTSKRTLSSSIDFPNSPIHKYASLGEVDSLRKLIVDLDADVNLPMKDGTTPTHCAAEFGQEECLKLLIDRGANLNVSRDDQLSPLHLAAANGHDRCVELLIHHGGTVCAVDSTNWTPLHWASASGNIKCCQVLLEHGAKRCAVTNNNWSPCHVSVHSGCAKCLEFLLTFESSQSEQLSKVRREVGKMVDKDGWTIAHLAAIRESQDCLSVILKYCDIDLNVRDNWGRSVVDIASSANNELLLRHENLQQMKCVPVEINCTGPLYEHHGSFVIGTIQILPKMGWLEVDQQVRTLVESHFQQLDTGLRTKKTSRLEPETSPEMTQQFSLGFTLDSIDSFNIGPFSWGTDGKYPDPTPQDVMLNNNVHTISVNIKGSSDACDSLAFDLLLPLHLLQNYLRLLDQYKCVVFYGPEGTRKKQLIKRLARHIAESASNKGSESHITQVYLHKDFSHRDFVKLLKNEGCIVPQGSDDISATPVLLLFHLEKVQLAQVLGSLLEHIEYRGSQHIFSLHDKDGVKTLHHFASNFYLIAAMDKARSTGLDLSIQQRFRWVHFRIDTEPVRNLLARHFLRRLVHTYDGQLPSSDDPVFKVVEWIVCVWQRLNDGLGKLGLPDVVFGPDLFFPCPLESQNDRSIYEWLKKLWNETISPVVKVGVVKGTGKEPIVDGQQKVANTALYVLMQSAIVPGCPLTGDEKERYLFELSGSNELEVPFRAEKSSSSVGSSGSPRRSLHNGSSQQSDLLTRAKHRNSTGTEGSLFVFGQSGSSIKRRSLSDPSLAQTESIEIPIIHERVEESGTNIQAKVPKLEIRSPMLGLTVSLPNTFSAVGRTSPLSNMTSGHSGRSSLPGHSRIPQATVSSKRSRSSENLSSLSHLHAKQNSQFKPASPFKFSLTMPTSTLSSFKFYDPKMRKSDSEHSNLKHMKKQKS